MKLKKMLSLFVLLSYLTIQIPAFSNNEEFEDSSLNNEYTETTLVHPNNEITISFVNNFNANKSKKGDIVEFKLNQHFSDKDGDVLPANTTFYGYVDSLTKSKFGFRKAKVHISINKMMLPNGKIYSIEASPKKSKLTSPTGANIAKGVTMATVSAGICMVSAIVIAIECLSVAGLVIAPYTGAAAGIMISSTSKGVNYKVPAGTKITIKFDRPLNIPNGLI